MYGFCAQNADIELLEKGVDIEINKVYQWLAANKLTLNISKSKFMMISNKKNTLNEFRVKIANEALESCDHYKYLGVIIDKNLNWKLHIERISVKISKACGALAKLRHSVGIKTLIEIYHALIHSYVRYGILTWGNACDGVLHELQLTLNRAVRIMTFAPFGRVNVTVIFKDLKILDAKSTHLLEKSKFMFKSKHHLLPLPIANHFKPNNLVDSRSYNLRSSGKTQQIFTRLTSSENSIQINGEKLWNEIPDSTKLFTTFSVFKRDIKTGLLENMA